MNYFLLLAKTQNLKMQNETEKQALVLGKNHKNSKAYISFTIEGKLLYNVEK